MSDRDKEECPYCGKMHLCNNLNIDRIRTKGEPCAATSLPSSSPSHPSPSLLTLSITDSDTDVCDTPVPEPPADAIPQEVIDYYSGPEAQEWMNAPMGTPVPEPPASETWQERAARLRHTPGSLLAYAMDENECAPTPQSTDVQEALATLADEVEHHVSPTYIHEPRDQVHRCLDASREALATITAHIDRIEAERDAWLALWDAAESQLNYGALPEVEDAVEALRPTVEAMRGERDE